MIEMAAINHFAGSRVGPRYCRRHHRPVIGDDLGFHMSAQRHRQPPLQLLAQLHRLPHGHGANRKPRIGVHFFPVRRHHRHKRIQFKIQIRMPGGDQFMIHVFFRRAQMAAQAFLAALD